MTMFDFEIQRCTRQCAATGRELTPGETIYSALVQQGAQVVRVDYAEDQWQGPSDEVVGFWKSQIPTANAAKMHWAPNDVMLHYFEQLADQPNKQDVRYVLGLLMIRRRILRLEESETDDAGQEVLVLYCPRSENEHRMNVMQPDASRIASIQEELAALLQTDVS